VQFSAQTVQSSADKTTRHARIYVGDNQVRMEYQQDGKETVEIYDMKNQRTLLLLPQQRTYMERKLPAVGAGNPMLPPKETNPCARLPKAECREMGRENMFGRPVVKWEVVVSHDDQPLRSLHWIDVERNMPLRQEYPDGSSSEMRLLGQESLNGRATERWQISMKRPDEESMKSTQWYDPELNIAIREELPGGFFRELRDIRVGAQPAQLFTLPAGYKLSTAPQGKPPAPAADASTSRAPVQQTPRYPAPQQVPAQQPRTPYPSQQYPAQQYPGR
jgi:hypothetical protein